MRGIEGSTGGSGVSCAELPVRIDFTTESGVHGAGRVSRSCAWAMAARNVTAAASAAARSTVGRDIADERITAPRGAWPAPEALRRLLMRFVAELLAADARLVHETALGGGEHGHALLVGARGLRVLLAGAGARRGSGGGRLRRGARADGDGRGLRAELEAAARELLECALVLEEHDHAVRLAAELEPDRDLRHGRVPQVRALLVHAPRAVRAADAEAALADGGEQGVGVGVLEEPPALAGIPERLDGVVVLVRARRCGGEREEDQRGEPAGVSVHDGPLPLPWGAAFRGDHRNETTSRGREAAEGPRLRLGTRSPRAMGQDAARSAQQIAVPPRRQKHSTSAKPAPRNAASSSSNGK